MSVYLYKVYNIQGWTATTKTLMKNEMRFKNTSDANQGMSAKYKRHHFRWRLHIKATWPTDSKLQVSSRTQQDKCKEAEADTSPTPTAFEQAKNTETTPK